MLTWLPPPVVGLLAFLLYLGNTLLWVLPLLLLALGQLLLPSGQRLALQRLLIRLGEGWIAGVARLTRLLYATDWDIQGPRQFDRNGWYLIVANHQSWVDLIVFMVVFGGGIPFPKIFAKQQMLWLPLLGQAIWALNYPLVKRYPRELLERRPELRGRDLEITKRACAAAATLPTSIVSFAEGTRCTPAKQAQQQSPYRRLLRPKVGGAALAITTLGPRLAGVIDLTIAYPAGPINFWQFLCGRLSKAVARVRLLELPAALRSGDYEADPEYRRALQAWFEQRWQEKDALLEELHP